MDKRINLNSWEGYYTVKGTGKSILLLHGFGEDASIWGDLSNRLSKQYQLIIPDLPGCGKSTLPPDGISVEEMADGLAEMLRQQNITETILIGHSLGGYIALAFAERHLHLLNKMVLFHSHAYADEKARLANRKKSITFIEKYGSAPFVNELLNNLVSEDFLRSNMELMEDLKQRFSSLTPETLIALTKAMMNRPERLHVLDDFHKPLLFILGREDKAVPLEMGLKQVERSPLSVVHILDKVGHCGMIEDPKSSFHIIDNFIKLNI